MPPVWGGSRVQPFSQVKRGAAGEKKSRNIKNRPSANVNIWQSYDIRMFDPGVDVDDLSGIIGDLGDTQPDILLHHKPRKDTINTADAITVNKTNSSKTTCCAQTS